VSSRLAVLTTLAEGSAENRREAARQAYRESVELGEPVSSQALAEQYERSRTWARERIAEVRAEDGMPPQDGVLGGVTEKPDQTPACHPATTALEAVDEEGFSTVETPGMTQPRGARAVAWLAFVVGIAASVAANIGHAYYPTAAQLDAWQQRGGTGEWHPEPGSIVAAGFWPLALLLAVEVLSRVRWQPGAWWSLARYGGLLLVALVAAVLSYRHMAGLLTVYGEDGLSAHLGPLAVDGLMVLSGFALLSMGSTPKKEN
jgi:hypothetical protein